MHVGKYIVLALTQKYGWFELKSIKRQKRKMKKMKMQNKKIIHPSTAN